jgi:hypothetical protein
VDILRCPTCTSLLLEPDVKRCPTCRSKLRKRSRPTAIAESNGLADRPLPLVERELRARIEAKTAAGFRRRRQAAKAARRIAALPSTVLEGDLVLLNTEPPATSQPATSAATIIDLPAEAVHDVTSTAEFDDVRAEPVVEVEPEPIVEPEVEPEPVEAEVVEAPPVVEPEVVEPEPEVVEPVVVVPEVVEPEPIVETEVVPEPEVIEAVPATAWQRSSSLWTDRVFNTVPRNRESEAVVWPPRWKPAAPFVDLTDDSDAEEIDASKA